MSTRATVEKAQFTPKTGSDQTPFPVHFNPVSLQYSVTNTLKEEGSGKSKKQYVTQGQGKLTMDLVFDNTADGQDVRLSTVKIAALMQPDPKSAGAKKQVPSIVLFEWGAYKFQGMMESYKETLDFFAPGGVPLRSSVNITLVEQDKIFEAGQADTSGDTSPDAVDVPPGPDSDPSSAASTGGDPNAARLLGSMNGAASLRFSAGASLTVSGSVSLGAPAAFASGGAGIGISAGAGIGIGASAGVSIGASAGASAGFGVSAGAGIGVSAGVSAGGAVFGSSASAGVTANEGAFAGLRVSSAPPTVTLDTGRFLQVSESVGVSTSSDTDFTLGGAAVSTGTAGLSADVGADVDLRARIQFEVE